MSTEDPIKINQKKVLEILSSSSSQEASSPDGESPFTPTPSPAGEPGSELRRLISLCEQTHPLIKNVKHPELFKRALEELRDDIIGMEKVKDAIASQTMYLLSLAKDHPEHMLHTVIYGPPGVGKTSIGKKLSKIWYALGYLKSESESKPSSSLGPYSTVSPGVWETALFVLLLYCSTIASIIYSTCKTLYCTFGWYFVAGVFLALAIFIIWLLAHKRSREGYLRPSDTSPESRKSRPDDTSLIKIVSREDFVAGYVGQTAIKTKQLLNSCLGKVLFIDEAYSLFHDERDSFGMEALTTLNLFMSEHPGEIVVIFAGYKDLMQQGIFRAQPGLVRRCMWHFECEDYTPDELLKIFSLQLKRSGWHLQDPDHALKLLRENRQIFSSQAGDTEKLCFFSQLAFTRDQFHLKGSLTSIDEKLRIITPSQLERGLALLRENNLNNNNKNTLETSISPQELEYLKRFLSSSSSSKPSSNKS